MRALKQNNLFLQSGRFCIVNAIKYVLDLLPVSERNTFTRLTVRTFGRSFIYIYKNFNVYIYIYNIFTGLKQVLCQLVTYKDLQPLIFLLEISCSCIFFETVGS